MKEIERRVQQMIGQGHTVHRQQMSLQQAVDSNDIVTVPNEVFYSILFCSILFYSSLVCVLPLREVALHQSPPTFSVLFLNVHTTPCCPTMSSLQRRFGLPTDLTPFVCHSVLNNSPSIMEQGLGQSYH